MLHYLSLISLQTNNLSLSQLFLKCSGDVPSSRPPRSPCTCCTAVLPPAICQMPLNKPQISPEIYSCCVCTSVPPPCAVPIGSIAGAGRFSEGPSPDGSDWLAGWWEWAELWGGTDQHEVQTEGRPHFTPGVSNSRQLRGHTKPNFIPSGPGVCSFAKLKQLLTKNTAISTVKLILMITFSKSKLCPK